MKALLYEGQPSQQLCSELLSAESFDLAFAAVSSGGYRFIEKSMKRCLGKGGQGRILVGTDLPTDPDVLEKLIVLERTSGGKLHLRRFQSSGRRIFHIKLAVFQHKGRRSAILGSSNLTVGGLERNHEANVFVDDHKTAVKFGDLFDEYFEGAYAKQIDSEWLLKYRKIWKIREKCECELRKVSGRLRDIKGRAVPQDVKPIPKTLQAHKVCFTGKIHGWKREHKLYPAVKRVGGNIVKSDKAMRAADCLVQGEMPSGKKSTVKLRAALRLKVPVITEDQFFKILAHSRRSSSK